MDSVHIAGGYAFPFAPHMHSRNRLLTLIFRCGGDVILRHPSWSNIHSPPQSNLLHLRRLIIISHQLGLAHRYLSRPHTSWLTLFYQVTDNGLSGVSVVLPPMVKTSTAESLVLPFHSTPPQTLEAEMFPLPLSIIRASITTQPDSCLRFSLSPLRSQCSRSLPAYWHFAPVSAALSPPSFAL
jgi:hypothetical protein